MASALWAALPVLLVVGALATGLGPRDVPGRGGAALEVDAAGRVATPRLVRTEATTGDVQSSLAGLRELDGGARRRRSSKWNGTSDLDPDDLWGGKRRSGAGSNSSAGSNGSAGNTSRAGSNSSAWKKKPTDFPGRRFGTPAPKIHPGWPILTTK